MLTLPLCRFQCKKWFHKIHFVKTIKTVLQSTPPQSLHLTFFPSFPSLLCMGFYTQQMLLGNILPSQLPTCQTVRTESASRKQCTANSLCFIMHADVTSSTSPGERASLQKAQDNKLLSVPCRELKHPPPSLFIFKIKTLSFKLKLQIISHMKGQLLHQPTPKALSSQFVN